MQDLTTAEPLHSPKQPWTTPQLSVYGTLRELTEKIGAFPDQAGGSFNGAPPGDPGYPGLSGTPG